MYESMSAGQDGKELQSIVDEDMTTPGSGDSEQPLRWMELLSFNQAQQEEGDHDLLKAMELVEEDKELQNQVEEDCELSKEVVAAIAAAREVDPKLTGFDKKRKTKEEKWGLVLVDRQRRKENDGTSMLQKAMELKKREKLDPLKGNVFAALQFDTLDILACEMNLQARVDKFDAMDDNLKVILPTNLNIECSIVEPASSHDKNNVIANTLENSFKETLSFPP
jgi:hypothetical protein